MKILNEIHMFQKRKKQLFAHSISVWFLYDVYRCSMYGIKGAWKDEVCLKGGSVEPLFSTVNILTIPKINE